ncbi:MAG: mechanosensitive ion channel family protein [Candidatus Omnitrophica bacterium]|nr:mechanosensitive ion channel family protein [Candidatus Omnitrophota bacterium]
MTDWTAVQELLAKDYFGNTVQSYVIAAATFCALFIGLPILKAIALKQLEGLAKRTRGDLDDLVVELTRQAFGPAVFFVTALYLGAQSLALAEGVRRILQALFAIVVTVKAVQLLQGVAVYGLKRWTERTARTSPTGAAMMQNLTMLIRLILWTAAALFVLDNLGINITAFVAGLGIGGVAVALAAQAILGDAFSSFAIYMDRPFEVGDFIVAGDFMGAVEHIGFKTTRVRSLGGEQLVFANSDLTGSRIRNYKRMQQRRIVFKLGVVYQTTPEQVRGIPKLIEGIVKEQQLTRFDRAHFQSFGDSALIFEVVYFVLSADYNLSMDVQQQINLRIMEEFQKAGIEFAYPTQQVYVTKTEP